MLIITGDITPPCGEATYLLSYDNVGNMVDSLLVSAQGYLTLPTEDNKSGESFTVESIITQDSIHIERNEEVGSLIKLGEFEREYRQLSYSCTYKLNDKGNFILIRKSKVKNEIIRYKIK
jgi:hypothetical protein